MTHAERHTLAAQYGVTVIHVFEGDVFCRINGFDAYDHQSWMAGDTIELGIYDDEELRDISFFHELGHYLDRSTQHGTKYAQEAAAWAKAYELAAKHGMTFSDKAKAWAAEQLETYRE